MGLETQSWAVCNNLACTMPAMHTFCPASSAGCQGPTRAQEVVGLLHPACMTVQCPVVWVRSVIRRLLAIKDSVCCAAVPGWKSCGTARKISSPARGTVSLSAPDKLECTSFHGHFLHPDCTGNHRKKSFTTLILNRSLWLCVTVAVCYREQIHTGAYPKAWC